MGKTFETKNRIVDLLKEGEKTPTEISETLKLVPSTVSQHLRELRDMGVIDEVPNPHFHNTKTFRLASGYDSALNRGQRVAASGRINPGIAIGAVIVLAIVAALVYELAGSTALLNSGTGTLPVLLTDPPQVPNGTTALTIYYSGVQLHQAGTANGTGFVNVNASGAVNLMSLINNTEVLAIAKVNASEKFDAVAIDVAKATITIDNATYNVTVPGNRVLIQLNQSVGTSSGGALIDFNPAIVQIYGANGSSFVMVPAGVALALTKGQLGTGLRIGAINALPPMLINSIAQARSRYNVSITGASIASVGNSTEISITVKDNGNSTVVLQHVVVSGFARAVSGFFGNGTTPFPFNGFNGTVPFPYNGAQPFPYNGEQQIPYNGYGSGQHGQYPYNGQHRFGSNAMPPQAGAPGGQYPPVPQPDRSAIQQTLQNDAHMVPGSSAFGLYFNQTIAFDSNYHSMLGFDVQANGTLSLPTSYTDVLQVQGYTLSPGQSVTLTFNGTIGLKDSAVRAAIIPNATYTVAVIGQGPPIATATVTAT